MWCSICAAFVSAGYTRCFGRASVNFCAPRCRTSQYRLTFILVPSVSLWNDLADPVFAGVGLAGFKSRANAFHIGLSFSHPFSLLPFFLPLLYFYWLALWGWRLRTDRCKSLSCIALLTSFTNYNNNIMPLPVSITINLESHAVCYGLLRHCYPQACESLLPSGL